MSTEFKKQIKDHISTIESAKGIYELFRLLNYPEEYLFDETYTRKKQEFQFRSEDIERILQIYQVMSIEGEIPVFLIETKTLSQSFIRNVTEKFDRNYRRFLLIFAEPDKHYSDILFVLPAREKVEGRYKLKLTRLNINKEEIIERNEHYTVIHILSKIQYENEDFRQLWKKWIKSFSVEKVTEEFFDDYQEIFFDLREKIKEQQIPQKEAHEFTLQLLNRIMFTYFIAKKKWLKYSNFMKWYWDEYKRNGKFGSDEFYEKWLKELFFKAFNNRQDEIVDLPENVKEVLMGFPYLNGGLFTENDNDKLDITISDDTFKRIFEFFEKYNFTIKEDAPFNVEVAVDPQMIGYVYESLSNVAEEIYDRNEMGIFYTPRVEVDFMCRRSLVEYLSKKLPEVPKEQFYHLLFDLPEEKYKCEKYFTRENLWYDLRDALDELSVVDPACGSGAFLVGMLGVLDELYKIIYKHTNDEMTDFERKFRIIQYSLYGVDVMPWAIHAAELRLWLQLIIETEINSEELKKSPLLPNLDLNLRIGDSIVQKIGGVNINLRTGRLTQKIKKRLEDLKEQKRLYYENSRSARLKRPEDFKNAEIKIFEDIIDYEIQRLEKKLEFKKKDLKSKQVTLTGEIKEKGHKFTKKEIKAFEDEIKRLVRIKGVLDQPGKKPFVWEIDFAEVFGKKGGFDIVIGNPPYLQQEDIAPPAKLKCNVTAKDKKEYKKDLLQSVRERLQLDIKIDGNSDYLIYFYFLGLGLLNKDGVFCFITSNSWLDSKYGISLQEFLLKYVPIISIYDNIKRSFEHANINTVISLFGSPILNRNKKIEFRHHFKSSFWKISGNIVKFVMFKKPFEEVINTTNLIKIDRITCKSSGAELKDLIKNIVSESDFKVFPIYQKDLLNDGWVYPKNSSPYNFEKGHYNGNKWNVKFLRAPKIFYKILERGTLKKLEEFGHIETYLNTGGADKFYFINLIEKKDKDYSLIENKEFKKRFLIESRFIKPLIKSSREVSNILIKQSDCKSHILVIDEKEDISNLKVMNYVKFGIKKGYNKRSGPSKRSPWWKLPNQAKKGSEILFPRNYHERFAVFYNPSQIISNRFFRFKAPKHSILIYLLNSTISYLMMEIYGKTNLGEGALELGKPELRLLPILDIEKMELENKFENNSLINRKMLSIFDECGINPLRPIREQTPNPLPDRAKVDSIIFDELKLTEQERKEVYWAVCELVKQRLDKAKSLKR